MSKHERAVAAAVAAADLLVENYRKDKCLGTVPGLHCVGGGHFSTVYRIDAAPNLVVKVTAGESDEASLTYLAWCRAHPGPHVPRVYYLRRATDIQVSVMNRLYPMDDDNRSKFYEYLHEFDGDLEAGMEDGYAPAFVVKQIQEFFSDIARWDLHADNAMQDENGVLVITDPITRCNDDQSRALRTGVERALGVKSD